jgi:anti-sigma B factor antagonist
MASEPLEIERLDRGVLSFRGPLTMENVSPFLNAVRREDAPTMILDFTGVPYLDSSGLGSLVSACTSCAKAGRRMALTGVNKRVLKVFEITRVEQIFLMFPTLSDALEAYGGLGGRKGDSMSQVKMSAAALCSSRLRPLSPVRQARETREAGHEAE